MTTSFDTYQRRRLRSSYFSVVISIALVLFMVGVFGLVLLKSTKVASHFKEKIAMTLFLKDHVTAENSKNLQESLATEPFVHQLYYTSKEEAAETYAKDLGENFLQYIGSNPLKNGIDIYLKATYVTPEKMKNLEIRFLKNTFVSEVSYDKPLIELLTKNSQRIGFWLLVLSGFFGIIAIVLINSSIRLSVYSKRFNIKTMQLVGATKSFIRRPFIWRSIRLGMLGAFFALAGLAAVVYYLDQYIPSLELLQDYTDLGYVAGGVLGAAFIITWLSTFFATKRFLNLQTDELYY